MFPLIPYVCSLNPFFHYFLRYLLVREVQRSVYGETRGVDVVRAVNHVTKLPAHVFTEPWSLVIPHEVCGCGCPCIIKCRPVVFKRLVCLLLRYETCVYHGGQNCLLPVHGTVRMVKRIVECRV